MLKKTKEHIIDLARSFLGIFIFAWWGMWSVSEGAGTFLPFKDFLLSLGGIL